MYNIVTTNWVEAKCDFEISAQELFVFEQREQENNVSCFLFFPFINKVYARSSQGGSYGVLPFEGLVETQA